VSNDLFDRNLRGLRMELYAEGSGHLQDGGEAWVAILAQGLVEALPTQTSISRHLAHSLGATC
jgi:hypothetical protein